MMSVSQIANQYDSGYQATMLRLGKIQIDDLFALNLQRPPPSCLEHVETLGAYRIPRRPAFSSHLINEPQYTALNRRSALEEAGHVPHRSENTTFAENNLI